MQIERKSSSDCFYFMKLSQRLLQFCAYHQRNNLNDLRKKPVSRFELTNNFFLIYQSKGGRTRMQLSGLTTLRSGLQEKRVT